MKKLFILGALLVSTFAFAKTPATEAVNNLLADGTYAAKDKSCAVNIITKHEAVVVTIQARENNGSVAILNSTSNYSVNEATGEISVKESLQFPHYENGGTRLLNIKRVNNDQVQFNLSYILMDHRGNDMSTYSRCVIDL